MNNYKIPIPINPQQFKQMAPNLTDSMLAQLANQARKQGILESEIQAGLEYIKNMR